MTTDIERERALIKDAVQRITRIMFDTPLRKREKDDRTGLLAPPPLKAFKRLEPMGFGIIDEDDWWIFNPIDCTPDVVWPLDVAFIAERHGENLTGGLMINHTSTITAKEARGSATRFSPFMIKEDVGIVYAGDNFLRTAAGIWAWVGGQWANADGHRRYWDGAIPELNQVPISDLIQPRLATAIALRQRYEWAVALGLNDDAPSIRFATDPTGIKELYRLRDVPQGRDRRDALIGWVEDHWRQKRNDPEIEIYVRKHLRGAMRFEWRGLVGEVLPSQFDIEKRDAMIAERKEMHLAGTDRRLSRNPR